MLDPINNKLKMSIEQKNIEWDKEAMWLDIESNLPRKKNRIGFFLLLGLFILIVATYAGYRIVSSPELPTPTDRINIASTNPAKSSKSQSSDDLESSEKPAILPVQQSTKENKAIASTPLNTTRDLAIQNTNTPIPDQATPIQNKNIAHSKNNKDNTLDHISTSSIETFVQIQIPQINRNIDIPENSINNITQDVDSKYTSENITQVPDNPRPLYATTYLNKLAPLVHYSTVPMVLDWKPSGISPIKADSRTLSLISYIGAYAFQKSYLSNELTSGSSSIYTPLESIQLGAGIKKELNDHWAVISGLELYYDTEKLDHIFRQSYNQTATLDSAFFYLDSSNQPAYISGQIEKKITESQHIISYNTKLDLGIPLYMSYQFSSNFSLFAGPSLRITAYEQGYTLLNENQYAAIEQSIFDTSSLNYSFDIGLSYHVNLRPNLRLHLRPTVKRQLNSYTDAASQQFKRHYYGANLGLEYRM